MMTTLCFSCEKRVLFWCLFLRVLLLTTLLMATQWNAQTKYSPWDQPRGLVVRVSDYYSWGPAFDSRLYRGNFPWRGDHGLGRLVEFRFKGPPETASSYITTHIIGDNVTGPHGRPNLRSQLHCCHAQEGGPRSPQGHVMALEGKKVLFLVFSSQVRDAVRLSLVSCIWNLCKITAIRQTFHPLTRVMWYRYAGWGTSASDCITIPHHPSRTTP